MVTSMGRRRTFSFVFATFWTVVALTLMSPARVNGGETNTGRAEVSKITIDLRSVISDKRIGFQRCVR